MPYYGFTCHGHLEFPESSAKHLHSQSVSQPPQLVNGSRHGHVCDPGSAGVSAPIRTQHGQPQRLQLKSRHIDPPSIAGNSLQRAGMGLNRLLLHQKAQGSAERFAQPGRLDSEQADIDADRGECRAPGHTLSSQARVCGENPRRLSA